MDFYAIKERNSKKGVIEVYPDFKVIRSKDLMIRGKAFYAIWDEANQLWSTDEYRVQQIVDRELIEHRDKIAEKFDGTVSVKLLGDFSTNGWNQFKNYLTKLSDNSHQLDENLTFLNTEVKKKDYVSRRLPYPLEKGKYDAWEELVGTLYDPGEREKLEWAIGAIVAGEAKTIQKFIVLYGEAGAGKSTILNVVQSLFDGYYTTFEARSLASSNNAFSTEVFRSNPHVAIQHDGDLSRIEDNTKLNSIVSHEYMTMNEKYKPSYTARANAFLFVATNKPVKITDAKSGIIRRLIDVHTSGRKIPTKKYFSLLSQVEFELGAIAYHCLEVYRELGKNHYSSYIPLDMMMQTDVFFNFVEENFLLFKNQEGISLSQAYDMYKAYCEESSIDFKLPRYKFREEFKNYFSKFSDIARIGGKQVRSYYSGFITSKFTNAEPEKVEDASWIVLDSTESLFDEMCADCLAQYASKTGTPPKKWSTVKTKLADLDTTQLHYVVTPSNHIVIDFDLKDEKGEKSATKNIEEASKWPPTYVEFSKSQAGLHLHYIYDGDVEKLSSMYSDGIEVKISKTGEIGPTSLRRKLSKCNNIPFATLNSGLPLKGEKVIHADSVQTEKGLRDLIVRNLHKEIHDSTKPSVDFIYKILEDAYESGLHYDVTDLRPRIMAFANNSTNNAKYCLRLVIKMKFKSEEPNETIVPYTNDTLVFFDVEVFPNLFIVNWKRQGEKEPPVHMINPTPDEIKDLLAMKLIGFNCRRYDNHILYGRYVGYDNAEIYEMSRRIINGSKNAYFSEAYSVSYTDVYDFASAANKKSLKKWQIELGIHHQELGHPFHEPLPEDKWDDAVSYCDNDVISTEVIFNHLSGDWAARQILAELSGLSVNDTTNQHAIRIIFGKNRHPQNEFVYTDLSEMFPGYKFERGKSTYRGEETGEGGYVYAQPGSYTNTAMLDVVNMHGASIEELDLFGPYTQKYKEIRAARNCVKHNDREPLKTLMEGRLIPFIERADKGELSMVDLSTALKTVLNSVYGLTFASFDNPCRDPRNKDNIVAKRGALFMIDLKHAVQEKGEVVAHIKTDSIKIPGASAEILKFITDFGARYGYEFDHEATYDRFCLVNDSVYIARYATGKHKGEWVAVGAQFQHPFVFKTLFSKEKLEFKDFCETKAVTTALYLDMNEGLGDDEHNYKFVGKTGLFCPVKPGSGGGILLRQKDDKYHAVTGTKGYRWMEAEVVEELGKQDCIDLDYFRTLADTARDAISFYIDFNWFVSNE